jgi:hypothetical protein
LGGFEHVVSRFVQQVSAVLGDVRRPMMGRFMSVSTFHLFDMAADVVHFAFQPLSLVMSPLTSEMVDLLLQVADLPMHLFDRRGAMMGWFVLVSSLYLLDLPVDALHLALQVLGVFVSSLVAEVVDLLLQVTDLFVQLVDWRVTVMGRGGPVSTLHFLSLME